MKKKLFTLIMMLISFSIQIFAQMRDYTAMVVDAETGEALFYVSVYAKFSQTGTLTNAGGHFRIKAQQNDTLIFSCIGYDSLRVSVKDIKEKVLMSLMIPITQQQVVVVPPPAAAPKVAEIINIVEDETEIPEEEVETAEEMNQAIVAVIGTDAPSAVVATGPVGSVVEADDDDRIYDVVEQKAQFPGGDAEYMKWLAENLKYPSICQEQGVQGRVVVKFVVNRDGSIVDVEIVRSPDPNLSKEAERVVKMMPKWQPARQGNKAVRSRFNLPVMFRLN